MFKVGLGSLVLMLALIAGQAAAQEVDAKGDKELGRLTQRIDKSAADSDAGRVTSRIVDEWKGTTFKLTAQDVQNLRAKGLGFGEISILLALTAKQPDAATAKSKSLSDILAMRQAGEGWGKLARDLGYKNLGSVIKSVKATEKSVARVAMEHREKAAKPGTMDRPERPEKMEKPDKPMRPEKPGR